MSEFRYEGDHFWNIAAVAFFFFVTTFAYWLVWEMGGDQFLYQLNLLDLTIIGFASFRLTRVLVNDKIFAFARDWFYDRENDVMVKPKKGFRRVIAELIECPWCTGLWASMITLVFYVGGPYLRFVVWMLAAAGIGMVFYTLSNMFSRIGVK